MPSKGKKKQPEPLYVLPATLSLPFVVGQHVRIPFYDSHKVPCYGVVIGFDFCSKRRPYLVRSRRTPKIILRCSAESLTAARL